MNLIFGLRITLRLCVSWGIRIPSAWLVNPIKERTFNGTTKRFRTVQAETAEPQKRNVENLFLRPNCAKPIVIRLAKKKMKRNQNSFAESTLKYY